MSKVTGTICKGRQPNISIVEGFTTFLMETKIEPSPLDIMLSNMALVNHIRAKFPNAREDFIHVLCNELEYSEENIENIITFIDKINYPTKSDEINQHFNMLQALLPKVNPDYLRKQCELFGGNYRAIKDFIDYALTVRTYPLMSEVQRHMMIVRQIKMYTKEFNVEEFVQQFPEPFKTFSNPKRKIKMALIDCQYALDFLRNKFENLMEETIFDTFVACSFKLYSTFQALKIMKPDKNDNLESLSLKRRNKNRLTLQSTNTELLQEIAYIEHEEEILNYIYEKMENDKNRMKKLRCEDLLTKCVCCFDDVLPENVMQCIDGCKFSKFCVDKNVEATYIDGKLNFVCLNCDAEIDLNNLHMALPLKSLKELPKKKAQVEDRKGVHYCPSCYCSALQNTSNNYFMMKCSNFECMMKFCKFCKKPEHLLYCPGNRKDGEPAMGLHYEDITISGSSSNSNISRIPSFGTIGTPLERKPMPFVTGSENNAILGWNVKGYSKSLQSLAFTI